MNQLLTKFKETPLRPVSDSVEALASSVEEYLVHKGKQVQFRRALYAFTYNFIMSSLGMESELETEAAEVVRHLVETIREFKLDLFRVTAQNPEMSMFDFLVSQQFNDLYDCLTATQQQLRGQEVSHGTPQKQEQRQTAYALRNGALRVRSSSLHCDSKFNPNELEFVMLQQYVYDCIGVEGEDQSRARANEAGSPKHFERRKNETLPQLFSFDSTFLKDLPLSKFNQVSNFDELSTDNKFNFTLVNQSIFDEQQQQVVQTSRFENKVIQEEDEELRRLENSSDLDDYCIRRLDSSMLSPRSENSRRMDQSLNEKYRQLAEREKQIAQRELKTMISEKHLNRQKQTQFEPNKENQGTNAPYELYCQQLRAVSKSNEETLKKQSL